VTYLERFQQLAIGLLVSACGVVAYLTLGMPFGGACLLFGAALGIASCITAPSASSHSAKVLSATLCGLTFTAPWVDAVLLEARIRARFSDYERAVPHIFAAAAQHCTWPESETLTAPRCRLEQHLSPDIRELATSIYADRNDDELWIVFTFRPGTRQALAFHHTEPDHARSLPNGWYLTAVTDAR
jgi:hypothetical protein